ncbi:MAG: RHS repeat protein, partial [Chloroflexi bacterium]|nr:RHS repeat protein [Chloroflexota bacterium]
LPASPDAVMALYKVAQQLGPGAAVAMVDLMEMTPAGFGRLAAEYSARIKAQQPVQPPVAQRAPARTTRGQQATTTKPKGAVASLSDYVAQLEELCRSSHPVLPHSGEFVHTETLLNIPGRGLDYEFSLSYHSQLIYNGPVGWGWEHNYDRRMVPAGGGSLALWDGAGQTGVFSWVAGQFVPSAGLYVAVVSATAGITITDRSGFVEGYFPLDGSPSAGRLRSMADRNGNTLSFAYDGQGRLATVTDTLGRLITYAYDANNRLTSVTDFAGRTVALAYDTNGDLLGLTTPAVTGTPNGNDFPSGKTTRFAYTSGFADQRLNHNLTHIIMPNQVADGSLTPSTINTYGTSGLQFDRVISQSWGGGRANASGIPAGGTVTFAYTTTIDADAPPAAASKTTITNRGGNVFEIWYDGAGHRLRARQWVGGQWLVTDYAYNADGQITHITYPAGNRTEYTYDEGAANTLARGNLLQTQQVPDAARGCDGLGSAPCSALVTTLTYEPAFQLVNSRTDARGNRTTYTHDARGNLTQISFPTVTVGLAAPQVAFESWTYNAWGQPLTYTDPEGTVTRYEYFTSGPLAGYRHSVIEASGTLDITTMYGYNVLGATTAVTDALGVRTDYAVNALGQLIKVSAAVASNGQAAPDYETLYWYDANDNLIRVDVENVTPDLDANFHPTGTHSRDAANPWWTTTYAYDLLDNRVRQTVEISPALAVTTEYRYDALERLVSITNPEGDVVAYSYDERNQPVQMVTGAGTAAAMTTTYAYDPNGNLLRESDGEGHATDYHYDGLDRLVGSVDALGNIRTVECDANGNEIATRMLDGQEGRNPGRNLDAAG